MVSASKTTAPPSSGFLRWRGMILLGLAFLSVVYFAVFFAVKDSTGFFEPAPEFCTDIPTGETCSRPDLFSFQVASQLAQVFMGMTGFLAWHVTRKAHSGVPATPEGRLFGRLPEAERLNAAIIVFQVWDFFFSLSIPEHATAVFLTHHILTGLTAYFSLEYQYAHHYALFFGGCSEISSIFLVLCDFDVYFPASRGGTWSAFILFNQAAFVLLFFYYRVWGWLSVSIRLWKDALHVLNKKTAQELRPGKSWFLYVFLAMDVILGLLQIYWFFFGMIPKIAEVFGDS